MATKGETLEEYLNKNHLGSYLAKFQQQGAWDVQDVLDGVDRKVLTQDIGMTNLEANKFMCIIENEKSSRVPSPLVCQGIEQNALSGDAFKMQKRKAALDIQYKLFASFTPEMKRIGPFNTDQLLYCDLVNIICNAERSELGEDLTVELYTCEGYPLACRPSSYISKLSDWSLEEYPDAPLLYAVPRLKSYTEKLAKYMTTGPLCDGVDSIFIRNKECGFNMTPIQTDCQQATYFQLIKRIQDVTGMPGHLIELYKNDKLIYSSIDVILSKLEIVNTSALEMQPKYEFWTPENKKNVSLIECKPTWHLEQSTYGITFFLSCLYSLADWMAEPQQKASRTPVKTLGHIRSITGCPPLIHALNLLFSRETLTLPHRVAIDECLVLLFKMIKPDMPKIHLPNFKVINSEKITEYSNYFWVYLIDNSTPGHMHTEQYSRFKLTCSETYHRMTNPVLVKDSNGEDHILEQSALKDKTLVKILYNYMRMIKCFINDEAIVWNYISTPICGIDLTGEWKSLINKCKNYPVLCVQAPLNVISNKCPRPCMIPTENGNIGIYIGPSKSGNILCTYHEILVDTFVLFDPQELDRAVKLNPSPCSDNLILLPQPYSPVLQYVTRNPEEVIMVILDTSKSMDSSYLDGKSKYQSVLEAFGAFCDRTTAYDFKLVIGLTLFAKDCDLQYPLSENFIEFEKQFESLPLGTHTAIYDAIKFAVDQLNNFTTHYPEYSYVPRRILCLTDGEDNNSTTTATAATRLLIENKIKLDCVLFSEDKVDTHAVAKASGGYSFRPKNSLELLTIFEQETMLSIKCRQHSTASFAPGEEIGLKEEMVKPFDTEPSHILPDKINDKVQTAPKCLSRALIQKLLTSRTNPQRTKRILQELAYYQTHPHSAFEVFTSEKNIDFWRIIMKGPDGTPYEGGIFELFIEFINDYPAKAPNIRFITPIYHCNINSSGRICHKILDRFYAPGVRVKGIFDHVYGLLISSVPDDPLDSVKAHAVAL